MDTPNFQFWNDVIKVFHQVGVLQIQNFFNTYLVEREGTTETEDGLNKCAKLSIYLYNSEEKVPIPAFEDIKIRKTDYACGLESIELGENIDYVRILNGKMTPPDPNNP